MEKSAVDFGRTAKDYAKHRAGFPDSFFQRLSSSGFLRESGKILDLGTGTGTLARGLAADGFSVVGMDPSSTLLAEARELSASVEFLQGKAEHTGLPAHSFDAVIVGQAWHWFEQEQALAEISRVLRSGGLLLVAYFDWMFLKGNPVDAMAQLRRKYNPSWKSSWPLGFYPSKPGDLIFPSFETIGSFQYEENIPYSHEDWRGRMRSYAGIGGNLPAATVEEFDAEFAAVLREKFPEQPMQIPHRVWLEAWKKS